MKPVIHGGEITDFAEKIGKPLEAIVDFSSNINPLGPPASLKAIYRASFDLLKRYPDPRARRLREALAQRLRFSIDNIIVGNGAIALIALAIKALAPGRVLLIEPCFTEYRRLALLNGARIDSIPLLSRQRFLFRVQEIIDRMPQVDMILLGHPNNPTGTSLSREHLLKLIQRAQEQNKFVLIDEAFIDWCLSQSIIEYLRDFQSCVVIRSLTKYFSLAGIRVGYAVGPDFLIAKMALMQETWSCNALAQRLGLAALEDQDFCQDTQRWFKRESSRFFKEVSRFSQIEIYPSQANFFLIRGSQALWQNIQRQGLYVRDVSDFQGLDASYARIALLRRRDNDLLIDQLKKFLSSNGSCDRFSG